MTSLAEALVSEQEGLRLAAYKDTLGYWTIGYGHMLPPGDYAGYIIGQSQAESWLEEDLGHATMLAGGFPHFDQLDEVRQAVLISICFQLGAKPFSWPNFMAGLREQDYERAAEAGLDTLWCRQTPKRCQLEMIMLKTGDWQT